MNVTTLSDLQTELDAAKDEYETLFEETINDIRLDNQALMECLKNQVNITISWEIMTKRLNHLHDASEVIVDELYSKAFKAALHNRHRDVQTAQAKEIAKADPDYVRARYLQNDIRNIRDEGRGILEVVVSRKFILNNIVTSLTNGIDTTIL